ncbi:Gag-Pol polyprotein [Plakobranchus ocellatus]|uniref:Gag-Pol polyprotein n=1 Tax=Plakobranchus ocellatus TaxID=259542 RepID=A0AAV4A4V3_9GAST|nr:Gag-Pol polyprotein [Plakobranchus ocellatus]
MQKLMPRNFKNSSMPKFTKFTVASKMLDLRLQQTPLTIQYSAKAKNAESRSPRANVQGRGKCYRCGYTNHTADKCKYKKYVCNQCNKKGHLAKARRSKNHQSTKLIEVEEEEEESYIFYNSGRRAFHITMNVNGKEVKMELDTGSGVTIMPEKIFTEIFQDEIKLKRTSQILKTYRGSIIPLKGKAMVNVKGKDGQMAQLRLLVADVPINPQC